METKVKPDTLTKLLHNATRFAAARRKPGYQIPPGVLPVFLDRLERIMSGEPEAAREAARERVRAILEGE